MHLYHQLPLPSLSTAAGEEQSCRSTVLSAGTAGVLHGIGNELMYGSDAALIVFICCKQAIWVSDLQSSIFIKVSHS